MSLTWVENKINVAEYMQLLQSTGWSGMLDKGAVKLEAALQGSWYSVAVYHAEDQIIGFGRVISDGVLHALICDIIIMPEYQSKGIGSKLLDQLVSQCKAHSITMIQLFSAKDKYTFYEKHGFKRRADDAPGMYYSV